MDSSVGALVGAAAGAFVGAAVLVAVVSVDRAVNFNAVATARPVVSYTASSRLPNQQVQGASFAPAQSSETYASRAIASTPQETSIYSWCFVTFAAVAGAINGLILFNNRKIAMATSTGRREALLAGVTAVGLTAAPAFAAYGDSANVFGKPKDVEQFFTASGTGWTVQIPGKYNGSKETENIDGLVSRWEDNFDAVNNSYVVVRQVGKSSTTELGSLDEVREKIITPLLGKQAIELPSISEGGFAPGRYGNAAVLDQSQTTKDGKTFYNYEILTRTADGNEGGRHQLFTLTVKDGKLFLYKCQAGDKRWFKGLERPIRTSLASFKVA